MREIFMDKGAVLVKDSVQPLLEKHAVLISVCYSCVTTITELGTLPTMHTMSLYSVPHKIKELLRSVSAINQEVTLPSNCQTDKTCVAYSCSGYVIAIGKKVTRLSVGDWVACAGAGYVHHADLICIPERLVVRINDLKNAPIASTTTIGSVALHALRRVGLGLGDTVCIYGLDLTGQFIVQLAKLSGCKVIAIDTCAHRLALAAQYGANITINTTTDDTETQLLLATERHGADATIITGAIHENTIIKEAVRYTRIKGRILVLGDADVHIDRQSLATKEIDLLVGSVYGSSCHENEYQTADRCDEGKWNERKNMQAFLHLLETKKVSVDGLITPQVALENVQQAYTDILKNKTLGAIVSYNHEHLPEQRTRQEPTEKEIRFVPAQHEKIRIAIIGVGTLAKEHLIPTINNLKSAQIQAIVDTNIANALSISRIYGAHCSYTADDNLFARDDVDMVVIASPHRFHAAQIMNALNHGKAVFVSKPMMTKLEQLQQIRQFIQHHPSVPFCVGYYRSFSPFIVKIKRLLEKRNSPLTISYRMNNATLSQTEWGKTHSLQGSIIDQACHIFDLFFCLTQAYPVSVSVEAVHAARDDIFPTDNFCVVLRMSDGSVCSLLHTTLGHYDLSSERMEIFFDKKSIILDDFNRLFGFGVPSWFNETAVIQDKGYESLIAQFFDEVRGIRTTPLVPIDRWYLVSELALVVDTLVCEGGGVKELMTPRPMVQPITI